jgi:uncharacterized iron-regulated protein
MFSALPLLAVLLLQTPASQGPATGAEPSAAAASYVPNRVFDTTAGKFVDFESMIADLTTADVVFVGEQHDDANTHRLELAILEGLLRRRIRPVLSLEMFERDVQPALDGYLSGRLAEAEFMKTSRPWPSYPGAYRGMVELARAHGWTVVAANVPRPIASSVAKSGQEALATLSPVDRGFVARDLECPLDSYFDRFAETMTGHPAGDQTPEQQRAMTERYYWSQCVKDETMAESIAAAATKGAANDSGSRAGPVVHYNGAFHSDFSQGTAERVIRRMPGKRSVVISMLPVSDLDALAPGAEDLKRARYLVYTVK